MIPLKDDNPTTTIPFVSRGIILMNIAVFVWQLTSPFGEARIASLFGAIPHNLMTFQSTQPVSPLASIFTSMFLHGGFFHIAGNMLYLWVFGDNIEDALGHVRFLIFYLFSGIVAAYSHAVFDPDSMIPMIGASGAISGVLGCYLYLFPRARIHTLFFFFIIVQIIQLPAVLVIGFWAVIQFVNGMVSSGQQGGVAWFAHIGGFLAGLLTAGLWVPRRRYFR